MNRGRTCDEDRRLRDDRQQPHGGAGRPRRLDRLAVRAAIRCARLASRRSSARPEHGRWLLAPRGRVRRVERRYRDQTLVLETDFHDRGRRRCASSTACRRGKSAPTSCASSRACAGRVGMRMELIIRGGYGAIVPWVRRVDGALLATAGPGIARIALRRRRCGARDSRTVADVHRRAGPARRRSCSRILPRICRARCRSTPMPRSTPPSAAGAPGAPAAPTTGAGARRCMRSLITLKALTYAPTGGIVAAVTTSLPEAIGGVRNWDYRYCWLRDATFTLYALLLAGYRDEARAWRRWLLRAAAGRPEDMQTVYGLSGERQLHRIRRCRGCPATRTRAPVRIGNAAATQSQLDIYGEVIEALQLARSAGLDPDADAWNFERALLDYLGIELDRARQRHLGNARAEAPLHPFQGDGLGRRRPGDQGGRAVRSRRAGRALARAARDASMRRSAARATTPSRNSFRAVLRLARGRREPAADADRRLSAGRTIRACAARWRRSGATWSSTGWSRAIATCRDVDALPPGEGVFLPCSFWLADNLSLAGRHAEAETPVQAPARSAQRRRSARRRVRSGRRAGSSAIFRRR